MLLTEEQAKTKWCPMSRVALSEGMAANRTAAMDPSGKGYANIYEETRCLASGCVWWEWDRPPEGRCGRAVTVR